jgi:hypothetical protein
MQEAGSTSDELPEWVEPFQNIQIMGWQGNSESAFLVDVALNSKKLSARALGAVAGMISNGPLSTQTWETCYIADIEKLGTVLDSSNKLLEMSYELACRYGQVQLALLTVCLLHLIAKDSPNANTLRILSNISDSGSRGSSRVILIGHHFSLFSQQFVSDILDDLRFVLGKKHVQGQHIILQNIFSFEDKFDASKNADSKELMYLCATHFLSQRLFENVVHLVPFFRFSAEEASESSDHVSVEENLSRKINLCLAQAHQAMGEFKTAAQLYKQSGYQEHHDKVIQCESSGSPFFSYVPHSKDESVNLSGWFAGSTVRIAGLCTLSVGQYALFCWKEKRFQQKQFCFMIVQRDDTTASMSIRSMQDTLPNVSKQWQTVILIPRISESKIALLVSSADVMDAIMTRSTAPGVESSPLQLWTFDFLSLKWNKMTTHGACPDQRALGASSTSIVGQLGDNVVLCIAKTSLGFESPGSSTNVYILNLLKLEWMCLQHPYDRGHIRFVRAVEITIEKPPSAATSASELAPLADISGSRQRALLIFRLGDSELQADGSELVPKYAVDLLSLNSSEGAGLLTFAWLPNIRTADICGHIASQIGASDKAFVVVDDTALVIGSYRGYAMSLAPMPGVLPMPSIIRDAGSYGEQTMKLAVNALTSTFEWHQPEPFNSWAVGPAKQVHAVYSPESDSCLVLLVQEADVLPFRFYRLNRASEISRQLAMGGAKERPARSLKSQFERIKQIQARPMRTCAHCNLLESTSGFFKRCAACHGPVYCGTVCQKMHWKSGHKAACSKGGASDS